MLFLYMLFVGPVLLAAVAFDSYASQRLENDVRSSDLALARALAFEVDADLEKALETVRLMAEEPSVIALDFEATQELFRDVSIARPEVNLIYRLGPEGIMLFHYPTGPTSTVGIDFAFRPYFKAALTSIAPVVSLGRISPTTNEAVATTVMPIRDASGEFQGVVATNIRLRSLSDSLRAIAAEYRDQDSLRVSIIDSDGQIIADPDPGRLLFRLSDELPQVVSEVLADQSGSQETSGPDGETWLTSYVPVPSAGWGVIVQRPTSVAFATASAFHRGLLLAIGVFVLGGLLFWLALSRRVIQPLEALSSFSHAVGPPGAADRRTRHEVERIAGRPDQIGRLSASLMRMERSIERRLTELETLLDTSKAVVSTLDARIVLDRILAQTSRLLGADTCAIVVHDPTREEFRVQASRGLSEEYIRRLRISTREPGSPTVRAIHSGQPIQVSDTENDPSFATSRARARAEGYRALLAVPLLTQHAPAAALLVYFDQPRRLREREISLVWNFANHAAMAIENATLFAHSDERLQEQTRRLEALVGSMTDGLILENPQGRVLYANRQVCEWARIDPHLLEQLSAQEVRSRLLDQAHDREAARAAIEAAVEAEAPNTAEITLAVGRRTLALRVQAFEVTDRTGETIGRGQIYQDITRYHELDAMKNSLISTVSHEVRTPLAAIKGYATTLLADDVSWDLASQREFLTVISSESDRLSALVDDLLDLSRIESGSLDMELTNCQVPDLVQAAAESSRPLNFGRLHLDIDPALPPLAVDRKRMEVVLRNLLENAARYAGSQATVTIRASRENGSLVIRVEDDGPGIPASLSEKVFEPFYQMETGLNRSSSGAGLGLSICRGFIHAHQGKIWVEPRQIGTCIALSLPLEKEVIS